MSHRDADANAGHMGPAEIPQQAAPHPSMAVLYPDTGDEHILGTLSSMDIVRLLWGATVTRRQSNGRFVASMATYTRKPVATTRAVNSGPPLFADGTSNHTLSNFRLVEIWIANVMVSSSFARRCVHFHRTLEDHTN